jgi:hypothetical protein
MDVAGCMPYIETINAVTLKRCSLTPILRLEETPLLFQGARLLLRAGSLLLQRDPNRCADDENAAQDAARRWCRSPDEVVDEQREDELSVLAICQTIDGYLVNFTYDEVCRSASLFPLQTLSQENL